MPVAQCAGIVAQRKLFAHVHKQLRGRRAAEEIGEHAQRGAVGLLHRLAETPADHELGLRHVHLLGIAPRLALERVETHIGADVIVDLAARQGRKRVAQQVFHALFVRAAAVEDLDGARLQQGAVLLRQLLIADRLRALLVAETVDGVVFAAAHLLDAARDRPADLVVDSGADGLQQLVALAVHILRQQQAAARVGRAQQLAQQLAGAAQRVGAGGKELLLRDAGKEAQALDLAEAAHDRLDRGAVQLVQAAGDRLHVAVGGGAAAQHLRQQRVHRRGLAPQLRQQADAQARGLEFVGADVGQPHAAHELRSCVLHLSALPESRFLINRDIISFSFPLG